MALIYVKAKPNRKAFYEGRVIPHDQFIQVADDPYLRRLADHWEDIELKEEAPAAAPKTASAPKPVATGPSPTPAPSAKPVVQPPPSVAPAPGTGAPKPQN